MHNICMKILGPGTSIFRFKVSWAELLHLLSGNSEANGLVKFVGSDYLSSLNIYLIIEAYVD